MKTKTLLLLFFLLASLQQAVAFQYRGVEYTVLSLGYNTGTCALTGVKESIACDYIIPSTVPYESISYKSYTLKVVEIGECAFVGNEDLFSVTIPNTVTTIKRAAFAGCRNLQSVNLPNSLTSIEESTFARCTNLTSVELPNSVTSIEECAFSACENLSSVKLSNALTSIGDYAFFLCCNLESIDFPESITSIGERAFAKNKFTTISIPASVKEIGIMAFSSCWRLQTICVSEKNQYFTSRDGVLFTKDLSTIMQLPGAYKGDYTIPNSVKNIGDYAFMDCPDLTAVSLPESITTIGNYAFDECIELNSIALSNSISSIGSGAFYDCNIKNIDLPESLTYIGEYAFSKCKNLSTITIPNSVKDIKHHTFSGCENLTEVILPPSLNSIGEEAFDYCSRLKSINVPNSVTSIGEGAFYWCGNLTKFIVPDNVTKIEENTFSECRNLTEVELPASLKSIGNLAFYRCKNLTSINIPKSVANIDSCAFGDCSGLTEITIPEAVTTIEEETFYGCSRLSKVFLPKGLTNIQRAAFSRCDLKEIICYAQIPPKCEKYCFDGYRELDEYRDVIGLERPIKILLHVPFFTYNKYRNAPVWSEFKDIVAEQGEIRLNTTAATMEVGEQLQLTATTFPSEGMEDISWYSPNQEVAKVSKTGLVTAVREGSAKIRVSCGGQSGPICMIKVVENSGVDDVFADKEEQIVVYNLQGFRLDITSKDQLSQLPVGIYLVNGKKYVLK